MTDGFHDDIEDFDYEGAGHDPDTCPNCMKFAMMGVLDYLVEQSIGTLMLVNSTGVYTFTAEQWANNINVMRDYISMVEAAVETVYTGTPFPWDKFGYNEEGEHGV